MNGLAMGIYDDLDNQTQPLLRLDPTLNNIIIFGGHRSGKTTFIKTMLVRLHERMEQDNARAIFILDFGGNLGQYRYLNYVAACFDNSNEENVRRVFRTVEGLLEKNIKMLSSRQFLDVYFSQEAVKPTHLMLVIDNVNSFLADERYESYHEILVKLCRDGLSKGLSVIFSATDLSGGLSRLLGNFQNKLALEGTADKYIDIFGMKMTEPMHNPGRGMTIIEGKPREFQLFMPFRDEERDLPMLENYLKDVPIVADRLTTFNGDLTEENFASYLAGAETVTTADPVVGLDYYDHTPISIQMEEAHCIAVYGKKKFGKTNLLKVMVRSIRREHPDYRFVFFDDGRKQLTQLYEEDAEHSFYIRSVEEMCEFLDENGYAAKVERGVVNKHFIERENPPSVFILQNKMLFQSNGAQLLKNVFPRMIAAAEEKKFWFIYSDVRKISNNDRDTESSLNNSISIAFLLDNIAEFVTDRGSRSVFGEMDPKELKNEYARCEVGDGYFFDIESDELRKIKIIKAQDPPADHT